MEVVFCMSCSQIGMDLGTSRCYWHGKHLGHANRLQFITISAIGCELATCQWRLGNILVLGIFGVYVPSDVAKGRRL